MPRKIALAIATAAALIAAAPAQAEPQIKTMATSPTEPFEVAVASDGRVWFSENGRLSRVEADGSVTPFTAGLGEFQRAERMTLGPDGNLWSAVNTDPGTAPSSILRTTPAGDTAVFPATRGAGDITGGPDGNLWFTASDRVQWVSPSGDSEGTAFTSGLPRSITTGSDGNLWVGVYDGVGVERVTPDGNVTEYDSPLLANMRITGMTLGPDGAVWFSMTDARTVGHGPGKIGRITTDGTITAIQDGVAGDLIDIALGKDGNLWVTERANELGGGRILRVTPAGQITPFTDGLGAGAPGRIVAHPDGSLWFTLTGTNEIARIGERPVAGPGPGPGPTPGTGGSAPGETPPGADTAPTSRITAPGARVRQPKRKALAVKGTAVDDKGVARVHISVVRRAGKRCESLTSAGRWKRYAATRRKCEPRFTIAAKGTARWSLQLKRKLPKGAYTVASRATDGAGQTEVKPRAKSVRVLR
jgi:virginiamycin B lyase